MKKVLASLDSVIYTLEDSGFILEAEDLHSVFIKVAEIEKDAGLKDAEYEDDTAAMSCRFF